MQNYMKISDFHLATALSALGYKVKKLNRSHSNKRVEFCFSIDDKETIYETVNKFWRGELLLDPQKIFFHQKILKNRLFENK